MQLTFIDSNEKEIKGSVELKSRLDHRALMGFQARAAKAQGEIAQGECLIIEFSKKITVGDKEFTDTAAKAKVLVDYGIPTGEFIALVEEASKLMNDVTSAKPKSSPDSTKDS